MPKNPDILMISEVPRFLCARSVPAKVMTALLDEIHIESVGQWRNRPAYSKAAIAANRDWLKGRVDRFYRELRTPPAPPEPPPAQASLPLLPANYKEELHAIGVGLSEQVKRLAALLKALP